MRAHRLVSSLFWHSDGRYILYAGEVVQNPPDKPPVDVASFKAWGDFAADKHSLYFEGKRTDNNGGGNRLDIKTLHQVEFRPPGILTYWG